MRKTRLLLLWVFLLGAIQLNAQYTFTATLRGGGSKECADVVAEAKSMYESIFNFAGFPTKAMCEQVRAMISSIRVGDRYCTVYYTTTPCTGTELNSFGSNSTSKISGMPSQNAGVAIRNEMQDYAYQQSIQNGINAANSVIVPGTTDYNASVNKIIANDISSGNNAQVVLKRMIPNLNDRIAETARLLLNLYEQGKHATDLSRMLSDQFKALTGFDIYELNNKIKPTPEELEILNSYNEYVDMVCKSAQDKLSAEEERVPELEMAAYSIAVYKDDGIESITDYFKPSPLRDMSVIRNPQERNGAEKIVNFINENEGKSGFNSEIYYDKDQDKYVIAIRGSEWKGLLDFETYKDWLVADASFALLATSPQHDIAYKLAQTIKNSGIPLDKIKITGHSLGGGLASIVGMITGCETYVYNPAHVSLEAAQHYKLDLSRQDNIHTYTAPTEAVTIVEAIANVYNSGRLKNIVGKPISATDAAVKAISLGLPKDQLASVIIAGSSNTAYLDLGSQETVETGEGLFAHSIHPMYNTIRSKDSSKKWMANRDAYKFVSNMRASGELSFKASTLNLIKVPSELQGLKISYRSKK
mgnify:CR=1 FL=1